MPDDETYDVEDEADVQAASPPRVVDGISPPL